MHHTGTDSGNQWQALYKAYWDDSIREAPPIKQPKAGGANKRKAKAEISAAEGSEEGRSKRAGAPGLAVAAFEARLIPPPAGGPDMPLGDGDGVGSAARVSSDLALGGDRSLGGDLSMGGAGAACGYSLSSRALSDSSLCFDAGPATSELEGGASRTWSEESGDWGGSMGGGDGGFP